MECPCQSQKEYEACCAPILQNPKAATSAEEMMRARYTAYTKLNLDFIQNTHDPKTRQDFDLTESQSWAEQSEWCGLEILSTEFGGPEDEKGKVEFKATYRDREGEKVHHEVSDFSKRKGIWYFSKGKNPNQVTQVRVEQRIGRNDPCFCGSGKKYKKCCFLNA